MKTWRTLALLVLAVGIVVGLTSKATGAEPPKWMDELMKGAAKARQELYSKFLPSPKDLGPGWLLPWQIPTPLRKFRSEDEFWQSDSGRSAGGSLGVSSGVSVFLGLTSEEVERVLGQLSALMAVELPKDDLPSGVSPDAFFFATMLTGVRVGLSASLTQRLELAMDYQQRMQRLMLEREPKREAAEGEAPPDTSFQDMFEVLLEPVKGMSPGEMKQAFLKEVTSVKKMTGMVYAKCDNWDALKSGEADSGKVHLGKVVVELIILDRDGVHEKTDDLEPQEVGPFQQKLNRTFRNLLAPLIQVEGKRKDKRVAELRKQLQAVEAADQRANIRERIQESEERFQKMQKSVSSFQIEVSRRDFGDNCYVVSTKGRVESPELSLPLARLNACLRNGSAVVMIELGGNFTQEQLKEELDRFLSEMDARTAFFRE